ncbi:hypothetical protein [Streptomyces sp. NPDC014733]|uniref:hypothetical protein n=1 Tax=Streptomyces sp. NPDC014733 TaxID=3364885 RepID=UPI0036F80155
MVPVRHPWRWAAVAVSAVLLAQVIHGRTGRVVPLLMAATVWCALLTGALSVLQHHVEHRLAKGATR